MIEELIIIDWLSECEISYGVCVVDFFYGYDVSCCFDV